MKHIFSFLTILFFISCNTPSEESHPREVWVFRSVLDEMPRMVTAALDEKLWVAYDTQTGLLYRAWSGDVLFDGAVISLDNLESSIYKSLLKADLNNGNQIIHFIFKYDPNSKLKSRYSIFRSSINAYLQFIEYLTANPICELNEEEVNSLRKSIYPVFWFKDSKPLPENFKNRDSILKVDDMEAKK